ncbi:hypothetical protein C8R44DRAFT_728774 [Mycena epipterygia]|nr:hypothetical protein C8R44DRAFT_728774 [Mycena epipterygia]
MSHHGTSTDNDRVPLFFISNFELILAKLCGRLRSGWFLPVIPVLNPRWIDFLHGVDPSGSASVVKAFGSLWTFRPNAPYYAMRESPIGRGLALLELIQVSKLDAPVGLDYLKSLVESVVGRGCIATVDDSLRFERSAGRVNLDRHQAEQLDKPRHISSLSSSRQLPQN